MKKCVKASITIRLKKEFVTLDIEGASTFDLRDEVDAENNKIAPSFPFFCIEEDEPLSDELINKLITKMIDAPIYMWRYELDRADLSQANKVQILQGLTKFKDAARESISLVFNDVEASKCGNDCEPADNEENPNLPPFVPEEEEENIFEGIENQCYEGSVDITYTLNGITKTETYRFYFTGNGEDVPESPTLETINDYFKNFRGTLLQPDWLDVEGATITTVKPQLLGQVFWLAVATGCDNEPPSEPEPEEPVPAPPPSPPPSPPPVPQPKPDKVINVELDACADKKITANIGLYDTLLRQILKKIHSNIIENVLQNIDNFRKFAPNSNPNTKTNKDSLIWIGSTENASIDNVSSVGILTSDNRWGILLNSKEDSVDLPIGFRFNAKFDLLLQFTATLSIKCGQETKDIPIFFGYKFVDSTIQLKKSKIFTFNRVPNKSIFSLALPATLDTVLKDLLMELDITTYRDTAGEKIANNLKAIVVQALSESKEASRCDCCLESISDIKLATAALELKNITTIGGSSIYQPEQKK